MTIQQFTQASTRRICHALNLSRSSFYHAGRPSPQHVSDQEVGEQIETIFREHRQRYGYRRIWHTLSDLGISCSPTRVRRLMRERKLHAIQPKKFKPKTSDGKANSPSRNLLAEAVPPCEPDESWVGDITFIQSRKGWLYLAVVMDLYSRRIVGWSLGETMKAELVAEALNQALGSRPAHGGPRLFHSDRGSQYGSQLFRRQLQLSDISQSMSRRANPYDNAFMESFMGTLKLELIRDGVFENTGDAKVELFEYIDGYYNNHRKHSALGYCSPAAFERGYQTQN